MSFLFSSFASSSVSSSSSAYGTQTRYRYRRQATPCERKFGTCILESWGAFWSIFWHTLLVLLTLFIGNGILKASMHGHLTYRIISLATLIGSPITHGTLELCLRIHEHLPDKMKLPWVVRLHTPDNPMLLWPFFPAIDGSVCGVLGILALRSSNSNHIELTSNILIMVEASAIGGGVLSLAMLILFGWALTSIRKAFDPRGYYISIKKRQHTSNQTSQTQNEVPTAESPQHDPTNKRTRANSKSTDSTITVIEPC